MYHNSAHPRQLYLEQNRSDLVGSDTLSSNTHSHVNGVRSTRNMFLWLFKLLCEVQLLGLPVDTCSLPFCVTGLLKMGALL